MKNHIPVRVAAALIASLALIVVAILWAGAHAQTVQNSNANPGPIGILSANVAVCDPFNPTNCLTPTSGGGGAVSSDTFGWNGSTWVKAPVNPTSSAFLVDGSATQIQGSVAGVAPPVGNNFLSIQGGASGTPVPVTGVVAASGTSSDASSGVATSATNTPTTSRLFGFNGVTWDQLQVDSSKFLKVNVAAQSFSSAPILVCASSLPINQTSSTDLHTFTTIGYICSVILVSASAQNISVIEGTGSVCASGTTALIGGTSASLAVAANGGFSAVAGVPWLKMNASADHLCLLQSGGGNVSGVITYQDHS